MAHTAATCRYFNTCRRRRAACRHATIDAYYVDMLRHMELRYVTMRH